MTKFSKNPQPPPPTPTAARPLAIAGKSPKAEQSNAAQHPILSKHAKHTVSPVKSKQPSKREELASDRASEILRQRKLERERQRQEVLIVAIYDPFYTLN